MFLNTGLTCPLSSVWFGLSFGLTLSSPGRSSLFPIEDSLLDDGHGNQGGLGPPCYPHQNGEHLERFSRKVFVGGLPPDIDEGEQSSPPLPPPLSLHLPLLLLSCFSFPPALLSLPPSSVILRLSSDEITTSFRRFGHLVVDWPHKAESKSYFPPKGTAEPPPPHTHTHTHTC